MCSIRFGTHLASLLRGRASQVILGDRSLTNIYYFSSIWHGESGSISRQLLDWLVSAVDPNRFIVYPLTKKDFEANLWQSSSRLAVIFEDPEDKRSSPEEFSKQYDLISAFIADGGQVLIMLKNPMTSINLHPTSLGNILWSRSPAEYADLGGWHWQLRDCDATRPSDQPDDYLVLVGETTLNLRPTTRLVVLSILSDGLAPEVFREAFALLGIDLSSTNGNHVDTNCQHSHGTSSNPIPLYSLILRSEQCALLNSLFPADEVVQMADGMHFTLHRFTKLDGLPAGFAWQDYVDTLKTENLGRTIIWAETMGSSWDFCLSFGNNLPTNSGILVVSNQQTRAKGRGDNKWISPHGQASFTFHLTVTNPSSCSFETQQPFSSLVTCLQHLVALSVVLACRQLIAEQLGAPVDSANSDDEFLSTFEHPGPRILIKWPNDVYVIPDSRTTSPALDSKFSMAGKLAGVLIRCTSISGENATFIAGVGLNVSNPLPTVCLQQVLNAACFPVPAKEITTASVIAAVMNRLEHLLARVLQSSTTSSLSWAMKLYTNCWIHSNQPLTIQPPPSVVSKGTSLVQCTVIGVDSFGYLRVRDSANGAEYSLHPDGNSMDMMRGLIIPK